jgi:hypothetical protein
VRIIGNDIPKTAREGYNQIMFRGKKMKSSRLSVFATAFFAAVSLLLVAMPNATASAEDQAEQAVSDSKNWVSEIDAGKYEESYNFACDAMREKVPQDHWVTVLKSLRSPWGSVVSRKQLSHIYKPNGIPGLEGECMVITYDTSFKKLDPATEIIVLKWENGKWRGAGYNAGPKVSPEDAQAAAAAPPASETETHTDPHVTPQPTVGQ